MTTDKLPLRRLAAKGAVKVTSKDEHDNLIEQFVHIDGGIGIEVDEDGTARVSICLLNPVDFFRNGFTRKKTLSRLRSLLNAKHKDTIFWQDKIPPEKAMAFITSAMSFFFFVCTNSPTVEVGVCNVFRDGDDAHHIQISLKNFLDMIKDNPDNVPASAAIEAQI